MSNNKSISLEFHADRYSSTQLADLRQRLSACHRIGDVSIVIEEWAEAHGYDADLLSEADILEWYIQESETNKQ